MKSLIDKAIEEMRTMPVPSGLSSRTLAGIGATPMSKADRRWVLALTALLSFAIAGLLYPRVAAARVIASIERAMAGKVMHMRTFDVTNGQRKLMFEMWTDGRRVRHAQGEILSIDDGQKEVRIDSATHTATITKSVGFKYEPSGFTMEAMITDLRSHVRPSSVGISSDDSDGRKVTVVRFKDRMTRYALYCDDATRLPYKMEFESSEKRGVSFIEFPDRIDEKLFASVIPKGFRVVDLSKGLPFSKPLFEKSANRAKVEIHDVSRNSKGDIFVLLRSNHVRRVRLVSAGTIVGPIWLSDSNSSPKQLQSHVFGWATRDVPPGNLRILIEVVDLQNSDPLDVPPIEASLAPRSVHGMPEYFDVLRELNIGPTKTDFDRLRRAASGQFALPIVNTTDLRIEAQFDFKRALLSGSIVNSTKRHQKSVALYYELFDMDGLTGSCVVRVGDIRAGGSAEFSQEVSALPSSGNFQIVDVKFKSLYDDTKGAN